jgi:hypothetical protein
MIYRKSNTWELWSGIHPASIGCMAQGKHQCDCKYHVVDTERTQIEGFDDFQLADADYCKKTGEKKFDLVLINHV